MLYILNIRRNFVNNRKNDDHSLFNKGTLSCAIYPLYKHINVLLLICYLRDVYRNMHICI